MSDASLRAEIKTILDTVPGAGKVYDYERWIIDPSKFLALFRNADKKIYGWDISRAAVPTVVRVTKKIEITHTYRLKGYYVLEDSAATEKSFNAIVDAILLAFVDTKIPGSQGHALPVVPVLGARFFGAVLCHYAEIVLKVSEIVTATSEEAGDLLRIGLNYYLPGDETVDATDIVELAE
jgi:hypothetical protein